MLNSNGSGKNWIKQVDPVGVEIGAGGSTQMTINPTMTTINTDLTLSKDLNAAGGMVRSYWFMSPALSNDVDTLLTASAIYTATDDYRYAKVPMRKAGSIVGVAVSAENGAIEAGSLSGTIYIDGVAKTTFAAHTGSVIIANWAKDTYTFNAGQVMTVRFVTDMDYVADPPDSVPYLAVVDVEY